MTIDQQQNLALMFFDQAKKRGSKPFLWEKIDGAYHPTTWAEASTRVQQIAKGLLSRGINPGDRIILLAENNPDWPIIDIAIMSIGAISVPAYTTNTAEDHYHVISNSGARAAMVSTLKLAQRFSEAAERYGELNFMAITQDPVGTGIKNATSLAALIEDGQSRSDNIEELAQTWQRTDTACLIYTSGTGGLPKGVMLSHGAVLHNCAGAENAIKALGLDDEVFLSFLPLSHSYEHMAGQFFPISIGAQIYYAEGIESLASNMAEAKPTIMTAVPRLYESLHQRITRGVQKQGGLKEKLFNKAHALGVKRYEGTSKFGLGEAVVDRVVDKLVREKVRQRFGGRLKALISGGAPLNPELGIFFTALGLRILQGYGQTESAPVISVNRPDNPKMHTVGPLLKNTEIKIAEDGEILCRGELVMQGYWRDEEATKSAINDDGWLHTGDIGVFDSDGHLLITDRKKDIIVNSGGDNIAPQRVEGVLCLEPEIAQAMVYGDKQSHLVALIVLDDETKRSLKDDDSINAAVKQAFGRSNQTLSNIEKVRHFIIADEAFTIDNGEMTPTMKVRRHKLKERYGERLEALYR